MEIINYLKRKDGRLEAIIAFVFNQEKYPFYRKQSEEYVGKADYQSLIRSIVGQQLSTTAASTIYQRLLNIMPGKIISPEHVINFSWEELKSCGLSTSKAKYILNISEMVTEGRFDFKALHNMSEEDARIKLQELKGVGAWTADMFLIFQLGKNDIFPIGDAGIKSAIKKMYNLENKTSDEILISIAEKWRPYRSVACKFLWKALDNKYFEQ